MATLSRADSFTQTYKKQEFYSDFVDSFATNPIDNNLGRVTNEASVKQSIKNLILTNMGERLFQPYVGSNAYKSLFDLNDGLTAGTIETNITNTLKNNEPRAHQLKVVVTDDIDKNYINITVVFYVINNPNPIDLTFNLKRVR